MKNAFEALINGNTRLFQTQELASTNEYLALHVN